MTRRGSVLGLMVAATPETNRDDLCHYCHVKPRAPNRSKCESCLELVREKERKQRAYRRKHKLCLTCGNAAAPERRYCERHLRYYRAYYKTNGQPMRQIRRRARQVALRRKRR
jgi:hypothetical protein